MELSKFKNLAPVRVKETFTELNLITKYLWELSQQFPEVIYENVKASMQKAYKRFTYSLGQGGIACLSCSYY